MKTLFFHRVSLAWLGTLLLSLASLLHAEPGDTTYVYSTIVPDRQPPYQTITAFGEQITGSGTGQYRSTAHRFKAEYSGPLEYIQVALLANGAGPAATVQVSIHEDGTQGPGPQLGAWPIRNIDLGRYRGHFAFHNYGSPDADEPVIVVKKGSYYWLKVEPLETASSVVWALSLSPKEAPRFRVGGPAEDTGYQAKELQAFYTVAAYEPYAPQVRSTGLPLVEGEQVPGEPAGVTLAALGSTPQTPCLGSLNVEKKKVPAILGSDGKVRLRVGQEVPGLPGTAISKLSEPSGDVVLATLRRQKSSPAITGTNDVVLIGGLQAASLQVLAQTGQPVAGAGGAVLSTVLSLDGGGTTTFFTAQLAGTGVTPKNKAALVAASPTLPPKLLVRTDTQLGTGRVTVLGTLVGFAGSLAEARWRASDDAMGVRLTLSTGASRLFTIPASAATPADWQPWLETGATLAEPLKGAVIKSLGVPGFGPDGVVCPVTLAVGVGGVTAKDSSALLQQTAAGGVQVIARMDGAPPDRAGEKWEGEKWKGFGTPVYGPAGQVAFAAALSGKNPAGVWWNSGSGLRLLARAGDAAPGMGTFASFSTLVFPNIVGGKPFLKAKLLAQAGTGINAASDEGIWGINSAGKLALVAREGGYVYLNDYLYGNYSGLAALLASLGSAGAAHGVDANGDLRVHAVINNRAGDKPVKKRAQFAVPVPQP